jgi:[CysO sulfur-carrier protein]-S-L-cysteine hydrolase
MRVDRSALDAIVAHAREAAPAECCGLLLGRDEEVAEAIRTRNVADQARSRFVIAPQDHIEGRRDARRRGLQVVGFYHSHPGSAATPSDIDIAEASYPDHLYLIVSLANAAPDIAIFRLDHGTFASVPFVTVG